MKLICLHAFQGLIEIQQLYFPVLCKECVMLTCSLINTFSIVLKDDDNEVCLIGVYVRKVSA